MWKLLGLAMNRQSHRCELLLLAYPGKEYVRFDADADAEDVEESATTQVTSDLSSNHLRPTDSSDTQPRSLPLAQAGQNHTQAFFSLNAREAAMRFKLEEPLQWLPHVLGEPPPGTKSLTIGGEYSTKPVTDGERLHYLGFDVSTPASALYPPAPQLLYEQIPEYYTWDAKHAVWRRRKAPHHETQVVTRIAVVRPSAGDVFFMRLRLLYPCCKGAISYTDLCTAHRHEPGRPNQPCRTFQEACIAEGLVADDSEWRAAMLEGVGLKCGPSLRSLFVEILMNCEPQKPDELWDEFKDELASDIAHANGHAESPSVVDHNEALRRIRDELQDFPAPKTLADCKLPAVNESSHPASSEVAEIRAERLLHENRQVQLGERYTAKLAQINDGQHATWATILSDIDAVFSEQRAALMPSVGRAHFIYARGGFGKTFLDELILDYTRSHEGFALAMASSGIASLLLEGARTVHSRCKVPLEITEGQMLNFGKHSATAKLIKRAVLLLWDECTMLSKEVLAIIDRSLRDLMGNELLFGGKLFVFTGDWAQCLPVAKNRHATVTSTHLQSDLWEHVTQHELIVNERVRQCQLRGDPAQAAKYAAWDAFLSDVGGGRCGEGVRSCDDSRHDAAKLMQLPDDIVFESQQLGDFVDHIYPDIASNYRDPKWLTQRAILAPKNDDVDEINREVLSRLPGDEITFLSADETTDDTSGLWSTDILNTFEPTGMPPHQLKLKVSCVVMLLRNLHATRGLCNGTRLIVTAVKKNVLICTILTGRKERIGTTVIIPRIKLHSAKGDLPCTLTRLQFPVRVAFGMTMCAGRASNYLPCLAPAFTPSPARRNKSQGQTLPFVGLYLPRPVFGHGQLYVGLSRVGDPSCIKVMVVDSREHGRFEGRKGVWTVNIVYPEVLADARRMLKASVAGIACIECEADEADEADDYAPCSSSSGAAAPDLNEDAPDDDGGDSGGSGSDDVDAKAVDTSLESNVLAPLRHMLGAAHVPTGLLTRQQAWSLAHASDFVASTADEMVDPWN